MGTKEESFNFLKELSNTSLSQAGQVLSILLEGKKIEVETVKVESISFEDLKKQIPASILQIELKYGNPFNDITCFFFKKEDMAKLAGLIIGAGEETTELSEMEMSIITEALTQMMNSYHSSLVSFLNMNIISPSSQIKLVTLNELNLPPTIIKINYKLSIPPVINTTFFQTISENFVETIFSFLMKEEKIEEQIQPVKEQPRKEIKKEKEPKMEAKSILEEGKDMEIKKVQFSSIEESGISPSPANIDLIMDVPLEISCELGRARKTIKEILELSPGSVVELDKLDGEPVDLLANGRLIARGEVVVIGETFGVRITDIISTQERMRKMRE